MLDIIQIGASRAASTWLWRVMLLHPELKFPTVGPNAPQGKKSGWFWNNNSPYWGQDGHYGQMKQLGIKTLPEYMKAFDPIEVGRKNVDITEGAAYIPRGRIDILKGVYPNVDILYCIRNPITTFWSHTQYHKLSIEEAIKHRGGNLIKNVEYLKNYNRWADAFGIENINPYFYNRVEANPVFTLHAISIFLDIDPMFWHSVPKEVITLRHNARVEPQPIPPSELKKMQKLFEKGINDLNDEWESIRVGHWMDGKE